MALSEQEQQMLREIEQSLLADDPKFGSSVGAESEGYFGDSRGNFSVRGLAVGVVGLLLLLGGVMLAQQSMWFIAVSVLGFLVMFGAGLWMLRGGGSAGEDADVLTLGGKGGRQTGARPAGSKSGLSQRMEENFRRRFDE